MFACTNCRLELPLLPAKRSGASFEWACTRCKECYTATLAPQADSAIAGNVQLAGFCIDLSLLPKPAVQATAGFEDQDERRSEGRQPLAVAVAAAPLDEELHPTGEPFALMTRDISTKGIGLVHTGPVFDAYLAVQIPSPAGEPIQVLVEVVRCNPVGDVWSIGGLFVQRLHGR